MKELAISAIVAVFIITPSYSQNIVKSYMHWETVSQSAYGPISGTVQNSALWVEWNENGSMCRMLDTTVWTYQGTDAMGNMHYVYSGSEGMTMPMTNYQKVIFSSDLSSMQIHYTFGMMGSYVPITATYRYIGEGKQTAYDHISGTY